MGEEWRPVVGHEGDYEVSSHGRVRSLKRSESVILRRLRRPNGYLAVSLYRNGRARRIGVHRIVAEAFIPNPDDLPFVRHKNDVKYENHASNLAWGTGGDNAIDRELNTPKVPRTHCKRNHPLIEGNTYIDRGTIVCATCKKAQVAASAARKKENRIVDHRP
ncbi:hypothetical protein BKA24_001746 [Microbacterium marinum]|uniref:NUMOD4 domain-containing protein n=1 Tax=Microbacterium marinum TaxID=421115 RepID=A0A7W7BQN3_9MICO|nr:NUMOD4 domain-containing protein [Microbacterium marinum]MBB4667037.1 hypothetical protein [Microbacterium marinum]